MTPVYGGPRRGTAWSMLRPGLRSALPRLLSWSPLGPADNTDLAALIARAEQADNPPFRTSAEETAEYFLDPTYSGVAGRDEDGVMRAFGLVRLRPAAEIFASMSGVVDPAWRRRGIGMALLHWQAERARHLVGAERSGRASPEGGRPVPAHVVTTVMEDDEGLKDHLAELGFEPRRWYREVRRSLSEPIPHVRTDGFLTIEPWAAEREGAVRRAHNEVIGQGWGNQVLTPEEWSVGRAFFAPSWSLVAVDRSGDRDRVAGYLRSARYEQDWQALVRGLHRHAGGARPVRRAGRGPGPADGGHARLRGRRHGLRGGGGGLGEPQRRRRPVRGPGLPRHPRHHPLRPGRVRAPGA